MQCIYNILTNHQQVSLELHPAMVRLRRFVDGQSTKLDYKSERNVLVSLNEEIEMKVRSKKRYDIRK